MNEISGGVCAPAGFRASGTVAHIKNLQSTKKDCALIVSDEPAAVAGMFTTNRVKAACILWNQSVCGRGIARAVFANSGNANACTGDRGLLDARATAERVAIGLDIDTDDVCVLSTGVIGVPLPMDRIFTGVDACLEALSREGGGDAAQAIMTTDTVPKEIAVRVPLDGGEVHIGAIAKGSGMIAPNMATMLCVITTDAAVAPHDLEPLLRFAVERTFNMMCVDNDMSTNDTVLCLANGRADLPPLRPGTANYNAFAKALEEVCFVLARALVRDGEGATKLVEIQVEGADTDRDAERIARSIATSQLCKTAFFGEDPNWGRIACAAGYSGVPFEPNALSIWLEDLLVVERGVPVDFEESEAAEVMQETDFKVRVRVGNGPGLCLFMTSDLSHEYVTINADYRT